jgi:hypothetical protein
MGARGGSFATAIAYANRSKTAVASRHPAGLASALSSPALLECAASIWTAGRNWVRRSTVTGGEFGRGVDGPGFHLSDHSSPGIRPTDLRRESANTIRYFRSPRSSLATVNPPPVRKRSRNRATGRTAAGGGRRTTSASPGPASASPWCRPSRHPFLSRLRPRPGALAGRRPP